MPGIAGIISPIPSARRVDQLQSMVQRMVHEAELKSGHCDFDRVRLTAGWVSRLDSFSDCMPVWNEARTVCLILTGEEFSSGDQLSALKRGGHERFREDASALVHLYEDLGPTFFTRLNGWFSGVLVDLRNDTVTLFNDRYGLSRIYIHETPGGFYFASEAKSLLRVLPQTRRLDDRGLGEWLSCGCVLQNRSLFFGITLLPPGSAWTFSGNGDAARNRYFAPTVLEAKPELSPADYYQRLKETFPRVLKRYLNGGHRIGMSLTGGLDGRMIMAWSPKGPGELPCYTFNGPYRDCADVRVARMVARTCGQSHETISVGDPFFKEFPALAEQAVYLTDGAMDVTGSVELYVNRLARQIAPVRLTGNYGSEILRNYVAFRPRRIPEGSFCDGLVEQGRLAVQSYAEEAEGSRLAFIAFKQVPWHHFGRFAIEQSQLTLRSPFLDNDLVELAFQAPRTGEEPSFRLIADGNPKLGRIPTDRGITYPARPVNNRLRRFVHESVARAEYAFDYGMPDWLVPVDRCLAPLRLDRLFLGRQKFYHFRGWYSRQLAGYVSQVLLDPRSRNRSYLNRKVLEPMVAAHRKGIKNSTTEIHKLLSLELLHRVLLDPS